MKTRLRSVISRLPIVNCLRGHEWIQVGITRSISHRGPRAGEQGAMRFSISVRGLSRVEPEGINSDVIKRVAGLPPVNVTACSAEGIVES